VSTVLVVDDHPDLCTMLGRLLRYAGHDATCVMDGAAALDFVNEQQPDVVLLDVMLPGLSGYEVLAALRADDRTRSVPVVMYSAMGDPSARRRAFELGAQEYLVKSCTGFDQLTATVERLATRPDGNGEGGDREDANHNRPPFDPAKAGPPV
jgi:CheY-like chemotaxis protein